MRSIWAKFQNFEGFFRQWVCLIGLHLVKVSSRLNDNWGITVKKTKKGPFHCHLLDWKPFNDEKCFLFHLKSSFCSQDIKVFVTVFYSCRKNGLIRKISLTSKFLTSQPRLQTIAIHVLPNISQIKDNQTMKFCQLIEYNQINACLQKLWGKWGKENASTPLFIFQKCLIWDDLDSSMAIFDFEHLQGVIWGQNEGKLGQETASTPLFIFQKCLIWDEIKWLAAYF